MAGLKPHQREINMNISIVFLFLVGFQCSCAYRMYYVEDECNSPRDFQQVHLELPASGRDSVGELKSNRFGTYSRTGRMCLVKLMPPEGYGVVVSVLKVDFRNHKRCKDYIEIYEGNSDEGEKLCGYQERGLDSKTFFSDDLIKVLYHTEKGGTGFHDGFRLIFTVTKLDENRKSVCTGSNEFRCDNSRCIWVGVICDGLNNCGDASDESSEAYPHCSRVTPVAIAAVVLGIISFVAIIIAMCLCCCRVPQEKQKPLSPLMDDFPSRPNGGYLPLPGYNFPSSRGAQLQPLHSSYSSACPSAPYSAGGPSTIHQKVEIRCDRPPPYRE